MIGAKMTSEGCGADVEQPACDPITCAGAEDQLPHPGSFSAAPVIAVTGDRAEEVGGIEIVGSDCFSPLDATPHSYKISGNTSLNFPTTCGEGNVSEGALPISSPSDPKLPEQPDNHSDKEDSEDFLLQHKKHVFILTSAGKPLFSRYGDDGRVSELFGVFQVLITMAQHRQEGSSLHWIGSANLNIYFHTDCGLHYVLVSGAGESPYSCKRQLLLITSSTAESRAQCR
uniref:Uncharacterized protein TCIL3000_10_2310 n=1 Tax=Trypanosoma congolense (strain IL3000) TaxID=1068625 RepID=G0UVQ6_TRYCI|nr:unnamed protein product [Trypanosoma congolense IL3000]